MAINFHPECGTILICDFDGFQVPEMTKRRPVVVVSPRIQRRRGLCTVVPFSTTQPNPVEAYHAEIITDPPLPAPYGSPSHWVKADMVYAVAFERLTLPFAGKNDRGQRIYDQRRLCDADMQRVRQAILCSLGLGRLTEHV